MKDGIKYFWIVLLMGSLIDTAAQHSLDQKLLFDREQFNLVESAEGAYRIYASDPDYFYQDEPGKPSLPCRSVKILVPAGAELLNYQFSTEKELLQRDIILDSDYPVFPVSVPLNINRDLPSDSNNAEQVPGKAVEFHSSQTMRGYTYFCFTVSPFIYEADQNLLYLVSKLELKLEYTLDPQEPAPLRHGDDVISTLKQQVLNPEALESFYPAKSFSIQKSEIGNLDYLIVTSSELKNSFKPLVEWKFRKGLKAEIITLEEIFSDYEGPTDQLKIKRCLHDYYIKRNLKWVLLGGDHDIVPIQRCYGVVNEDIDDNTIPTDHFYACFDKNFDWNATVDERIGEPHIDYVDVLPEIYISRIPVRNPDHVQTFVRKTLEYEQDPPRKNFAEKMLLSGVKSWNIWENKSDNHHRTEYMYRKYVHSNWYGKKYDFYDTGSSFPDGDQYDVSAQNLTQQLNEGYGIFHFAGHGNRTSLLMETGAIFSTRESSELKHHGSGIMLTTTCDINAFDDPDQCLSESFLLNPDGGCTALFGSSRLGLGRPDTLANLGPSYKYNGKFLEYLFSDIFTPGSRSFGAIATAAKASFSGNGTGGYWYLQYALNAMGDPELPIYTKDPSEFDNVKIFRWGNKLRVNTGGVDNCRISLTGKNPEEGFQSVVDGVGYHTFQEVPGQFQVTITKPNYVPYRYRYGMLTGLNDEIEGNIRVYPNPAIEKLHLDLHFLQEARFMIYDLNGRMVLEGKLVYGQNQVPVNEISSGVYILQVNHESGTESLKIFIR